MADYQRPKVTVDQNITMTPTAVDRDQPAFVFGPNYELHRYSNDDEKAGTSVGTYEGKPMNVGYPGVVDDSKVDTKGYTKLHGDNVVVQLADLTGSGHAELPEADDTENPDVDANGGYTELLVGGNYVDDGSIDGSGETSYDGLVRPLENGDRLAVSYKNVSGDEFSFMTVVKEVEFVKDEDSSSSDSSSDDSSKFMWKFYAGTGASQEDAELVEEFSRANRSTFTAVLDGNQVSCSGYDSTRWGVSTTVMANPDPNEFYALVTKVGTSLAFYMYCKKIFVGQGTLIKIAEAVPYNGLNEDSVKVSLVEVVQGVEFDRKNWKKQLESSSVGDYQWQEKEIVDSATGNYFGISISELNAEVDAGYFSKPTWCKVLFADLYVTYRELNTAWATSISSITGGSSEVSSTLGTVDPDNPLAMGVYMAALNAATDDGDEAPAVYFMATPTDDEAGYDFVLERASLTDRIYVLSPTTNDDAIIEKVLAHVEKYSSKEEKMWRIASGSAKVPEGIELLNDLVKSNGGDFLAIPVSPVGTAGSYADRYTMLRVVKSKNDISGNQNVQFRNIPVVEGDTVRFNFRKDAWGDEVFDEYVVKRVVNNYTLELKRKVVVGSNMIYDPLLGSYVPTKIEVYHEYTDDELASQVSSLSRHMASRRMVNVFPWKFEYNGMTLGGEFAACAVAGLISGTEPQQPITNLPVRGISSIPLTYQTFNKEQLDEIASGGTFIVAQDLPGDTVYVRHQITTAYKDGNLNTAELSITRDVDYISYMFADVFRPYYGKYNITPDLLATLETTAQGLIYRLGASRSAYGPYLITEGTSIEYVRQNQVFKDHVDIGILLEVPYPCNVIEIVLTV